MKKLILSAAIMFALSASAGIMAQENKTAQKKEKTECCSKKEGEKKECCTKKEGEKKACCSDKKTESKEKKVEKK